MRQRSAKISTEQNPGNESHQKICFDIPEFPVCMRADSARRYHCKKRTALCQVLFKANKQHPSRNHDRSASDAHHTGEKTGENAGQEQYEDFWQTRFHAMNMRKI